MGSFQFIKKKKPLYFDSKNSRILKKQVLRIADSKRENSSGLFILCSWNYKEKFLTSWNFKEKFYQVH